MNFIKKSFLINSEMKILTSVLLSFGHYFTIHFSDSIGYRDIDISCEKVENILPIDMGTTNMSARWVPHLIHDQKFPRMIT